MAKRFAKRKKYSHQSSLLAAFAGLFFVMTSVALMADMTTTDTATLRSGSSSTSVSGWSTHQSSSSSGGKTEDSEHYEEEDDNYENDSCYIQKVPCPVIGSTCALQPYAIVGMCNDVTCTSETCVRKERVDSGEGYSLQSLCILRKSPCDAGDVNCYAAPTVSRVECTDPSCLSGGLGITCDRTSVIINDSGLILGLKGGLPMGSSAGSAASSKQTSSMVITPATGTTLPVLCPAGWHETCDSSGSSGTKQCVCTPDNEPEQNTSGRGDGFASSRPSQTKGEAAGCFSVDGTWTTDRTACDANQLRHFVNPAGTPQTIPVTGQQGLSASSANEIAFRRVIDAKFVPPVVRDERAEKLIANTSDALGRLENILASNVLNEEAANVIRKTAESLRITLATATSSPLDSRGIQDAAEDTRTALAEAQNALSQSEIPRPEPVSLTRKFDHIFSSLTGVFKLLQEENIPLTGGMVGPYMESTALYAELKPACEADASQCVRLQEVYNSLESMMTEIRSSLEKASRTDLEDRIRELFRQA